MKTLFALLIPVCVPALLTAQTPQQVADDRLAADRAFSAASVKTNLVARDVRIRHRHDGAR